MPCLTIGQPVPDLRIRPRIVEKHKLSPSFVENVVPQAKKKAEAQTRHVRKRSQDCRDEEAPSRHPLRQYPNYVYAQPIIDPTWRGCFETCIGIFGTLVAHLSNNACPKVGEAANLMPAELCIKMMPRLEAWPRNFNVSAPTDKNIALYFFPESNSFVQGFDQLVNHIIKCDLVLKVLFDNVELLIFSSNMLPPPYWRFNGKYYMWGLFRRRKDSPNDSISQTAGDINNKSLVGGGAGDNSPSYEPSDCMLIATTSDTDESSRRSIPSCESSSNDLHGVNNGQQQQQAPEVKVPKSLSNEIDAILESLPDSFYQFLKNYRRIKDGQKQGSLLRMRSIMGMVNQEKR